jgi:putative redox protein
MEVTVSLDRSLHFIGQNGRGHTTDFDTTEAGGGLNSAASPMEITLEAAAACTSMDVVGILTKRQKTIEALTVNVVGDRAEDHPRIFTHMHMVFRVVSPDIEMKEFKDAIEISHEKYCSVTIMLKRAGCDVSWEAQLVHSQDGTTLVALSSNAGQPQAT